MPRSQISPSGTWYWETETAEQLCKACQKVSDIFLAYEPPFDVVVAIIGILNAGGADTGSVVDFLNNTSDAIDDMGGTLGAILGILLSAFTSALKASSANRTSHSDAAILATALNQAVDSLKTHTSAREGDRTVMDTLIPFAEAFASTGDFHHAVGVAHEKAEATRYLKARFGRATYVAEAQGQELPDPGAWAFYEWVKGMAQAIEAARP